MWLFFFHLYLTSKYLVKKLNMHACLNLNLLYIRLLSDGAISWFSMTGLPIAGASNAYVFVLFRTPSTEKRHQKPGHQTPGHQILGTKWYLTSYNSWISKNSKIQLVSSLVFYVVPKFWLMFLNLRGEYFLVVFILRSAYAPLLFDLLGIETIS